MTVETARPDTRRRYVIAGALVVVSVALGAVFGVVVARALAGYEIEPVTDLAGSSVTLGDRPLAVWASPEGVDANCTATDVEGNDALATGLSTSMSITDGGRSWTRIGVVDGASGSTVTLSCEGYADLTIGVADNPRLLRYVVLGVALVGTAGLLVIIAFVLALVTAMRRRPLT